MHRQIVFAETPVAAASFDQALNGNYKINVWGDEKPSYDGTTALGGMLPRQKHFFRYAHSGNSYRHIRPSLRRQG
jgi:hypothetical protein